MTGTPAVYIAYTGQVNPPDVKPVLTHEQVWAGLEIKVDNAQEFVGAIASTDIISRKVDNHGRKVTEREVVFREGNRRVKEEVFHFHPTKHVFRQPDGSQVQNITSTGANGELMLTFDFEWLHEGMSDEDLKEAKEKYTKMSQTAVESTLDAIRKMVQSGRIPS